MIIAGANLGQTYSGKSLRDGGAALAVDGEVRVAVAEERVVREKAAGGYEGSLRACLEAVGAKDYDRLYLSSCCQPKSGFASEKIRYVDHHESHAALSYFTSSYDEALVIVADAGGDVISQAPDVSRWWEHPRQQVSVYKAQGTTLTILDRPFFSAGACGFGEMYRAFTHYLGWPSGRHSGKTMALSAYGDRQQIAKDPYFYEFDRTQDELTCLVKCIIPANPAETARQLLIATGRNDLVSRWEETKCEQARADIALVAQRNLENGLFLLAEHWVSKTNSRSICLSGGVALNCTAVEKLRERLGLDVYVPPGAGDNGQSLGNLIVGSLIEQKRVPKIPSFPYLGPSHIVSEGKVRQALLNAGLNASYTAFTNPETVNDEIANALFKDEIVFVYRGRSEFGARALGNRSILANPQSASVLNRLNLLKGREQFNPFAASCIKEDAKYFFKNPGLSPYMTFALPALERMSQSFARTLIHEDNTCRAQVFERSHNTEYYDLLCRFKSMSGFGMVLNTSLNGPGEPMVESPEDAINLFASTDIASTLVLDRFIIRKNQLSD
jgi:carbamoyltransferase